MSLGTGQVITAKQFNDIVSNISSTDIRVYKNNYATTGTYTVYASALFGDISRYNSFEAYMVLSGTFSASHWGRIGQSIQSLNKITQPSKGVFQVQTTCGTYGWGTGGQSSLYYDLIIVGKIVENIALTDRGFLTSDYTAERSLKGETETNPARNANEVKVVNPYATDGVYWIKPDGATKAFPVWCKFDNDGAWMLVWSNLRGMSNKVTTNMTWDVAVSNSIPLWNLPDNHINPDTGLKMISGNKELWEVYTPLNLWNQLIGNKRGRFKYEWRYNYGSGLNRELLCDIDPFTSSDNYKLRLKNVKRGWSAGIYWYHNGRPFSTYNSDHDAYSGNCPSLYSGTPFWYGSCWSGSINGGGQYSGSGYYNGAYWYSSHKMWGNPLGYGAGNGWMYVQYI